MPAIAITEEYGYVILVAAGSMILNFWQMKRIGGLRKKHKITYPAMTSDKHEDFPSMLAEALDAVFAKDADVRVAAAALGCSTSQLIRFLAKEPEAMQMVNAAREKTGLRRLKP